MWEARCRRLGDGLSDNAGLCPGNFNGRATEADLTSRHGAKGASARGGLVVNRRQSGDRKVKARHTAIPALTLVECLLASVILAFAVVAISQAVLAGQRQTYAALHQRRAVELAEALMDEVLHLPYDDPDGASTPGPEAGETGRSAFDNADDYHGFSESGGSLADASETIYPAAFQDFSRSVAAAYASVSVTGFADPLPGLTITVTVQDSTGQSWTLTRFIAQPPS